MKPFDLQEALNGALVQLRNGEKAYVVGLSKVGAEDGNSYIVGEYERNLCNWSKDGKYWLNRESEWDIVGMYEEPELNSEQVLERAYQENLPVNSLGKEVFVIAKTKNGDYVIQEDRDIIYIADLRYKWEFYKDPAPKSDTITVTLPKPFKPKTGEEYYFIRVKGLFFGFDIDKFEFDDSELCINHSSNGRCFRTESDAQAWLDAMANALDD
ncbi:hypothetical protein [Haemophilus parainfluenzae]|uniref:hypothetical protein n=1 Tax=Haemophilus parainfluenzae TaxID=729 RepID=UPI00195A017A|nr:hypothetical protein [Haemophilus parainfluenzae]VTX60592.1 Uncharacterised protein [Haemophilus parainfluenzae]